MSIVRETVKIVGASMPMSFADRLLKNDFEGGRVALQSGSAKAYEAAIEENLIAAGRGVFRAIPVAGSLDPILQTASYPRAVVWAVKESPVEIGAVRTALPLSTLSFNPMTWFVNGAVQLIAAAKDFLQAAAAHKKQGSTNSSCPG